MRTIKKQLLVLTAVLAFFGVQINAQDQWEPQTKISGYLSTEFNYFNDLDGYDKEYGVALSEAGILASYQPLKDVSLKMVFVYRPDYSIDQMINEANIQYRLSQNVNFKVGRFLTPLSPMNTYYYAPVNISATLPVLISNHEFFPLNMDAISLNGKFGDDVSISYDVFAGGYNNAMWLNTGAVGFFGNEVSYYGALLNSPFTIDDSYKATRNLAVGGNIRFAYQDYVNIGLSMFNSQKEKVPAMVMGNNSVLIFDSERFSYGIDAKLSYNNTQLIGGFWNSDLTINNKFIDHKGAFVELNHSFVKITPYVRYEDQTSFYIEFQRYTGGVMYKPSFETTLKCEYLHYEQEVQNLDGFVVSLIYSF
ncbi:hypothetical protein [Saccharicrinis fermentans]|uniref:Phosphate-selective porin n=1 Tax=Saccharicrinis fermentans DSM 9555 = JCM 21142 TaxID=869213 RepID=W7YGX4_9BACT|nr:hypothetical protein [Saccharicrinis fermentans]GAF01854.1 hypothetical protein JCM21142_473 [Saccharicrinis fermentans DSM 9555 = JCM 21142]